VPVWDQYDKEPQHVTLGTAIDQLASYSRSLATDSSVEKGDAEFFYIYRNSVGETNNYLNQTMSLYISGEIEQLELITQTIVEITLASTAVACVLYIVIIIPFILRVESENNNTWNLLLSIPAATIQEVVRAINDRFYDIHGIENIEIDALGNAKKAIKKLKNDHTPAKNTIRNRFKFIILMMPVVAIFLIFMMISWQVWLPETMTIIHDKLNISDWSDMRR
jgi:predicted small metal-binding protein